MKAFISLVMLGLAVLWASPRQALAVQSKCDSYLVGQANGERVAVPRIESILGRNVKVLDVSDAINERVAKSDPNLKIFDLSSVFAEGKVFLGFGKPNVYLALPQERNYVKFAAKSLKRGDSELLETHNVAQSGLLVVFKDLDPTIQEKIFASAQKHVGTRRWTCVNANCQVLADAGFTVGGESLAQYYFPLPLLRDILRFGLQHEGKAVEFDLIRTNADYLEDIGMEIEKSVWTTFCRHAERACATKPALIKIKHGAKSILGMFVAEQNRDNAGAVNGKRLESKLVRLENDSPDGPRFDIEVSEPSQIGTLMRLIWGPHSLFEVPVEPALVDQYLPNKLQAFPQKNPTLVTRLKKNILFSKPVVKFLRGHLANQYSTFSNMSEKNLFDMMRADSADYSNRYNYVLVGDRIILMKISIQQQMVDWILSKHVLMSGYSDDARVAGEIWKGEDNKLHLNVNSGTYQPTDQNLESLSKLFQKVLPNIQVEIHPTVIE